MGWVGLTFYVVWYETGEYYPQLQHAYFWRWVICGILTHTPVIDTIALRCKELDIIKPVPVTTTIA